MNGPAVIVFKLVASVPKPHHPAIALNLSLVGFEPYIIDSEARTVVISRPNDNARIDLGYI